MDSDHNAFAHARANYDAERRRINKAANPYAEGTYQHALFVAQQIWDEYMSQIGGCVSQDYARLVSFPSLCAKLGVKAP